MSVLKYVITISIVLPMICFGGLAQAQVKGIYVTQSSVENTRYLQHLIDRSTAVGINTFVVDLHRPSKSYNRNIQRVHQHGLRYIARIVVFPHGGNHTQVTSRAYWQRKYQLVKHAVALGAHAIQLDYIRYHTGRAPSRNNVQHIHRVIRWFKDRVAQHGVPLEIDVFGETSFKPSYRIGQDVRAFAPTVDAVNPMVYPSHYEPARYHSKRPYETVYKSLQAMKKQFNGNPPFRIHAYIEAHNYRYPMSYHQKKEYLRAQIKAVQDSQVAGWYVWSANNKYGHLFDLLASRMASVSGASAF